MTPADAPGFPVTLSTSGSYVLTSDLAVSNADQGGIQVFGSPQPGTVTLELNGFEVCGPIVCTGTGAGLSCGAGTGVGISAFQTARITIHDGGVKGFGDRGIGVQGVSPSPLCLIDRVHATENGGNGISGPCNVMASTAIKIGQEGLSPTSSPAASPPRTRGAVSLRSGESPTVRPARMGSSVSPSVEGE